MMGRVTRRSVASKEESTPKESPKSSGRRGMKKEKPEDASEGDSQETPKRGGRQPAKDEQKADVPAKGRSASRGRSTSRGGRGKKEEEEEDNKETEDVENEEEVEEKKPTRGSTRSRGKAQVKVAQEEKTSKPGQNSVRSGRGVKSSEVEGTDDEDDKSNKNDEKIDENNGPARSSGRRVRGKTTAVTPSPQVERRSRGKATAEPDNEEKIEDEKADLEGAEQSEVLDNKSEATPKGRQRRTATKVADSSEAVSPGARKGRNQKPTPKASSTTSRSSRRSGGVENSVDKLSEKAETAEDMDVTEEVETVKSEEKEKLPASETELEVKEGSLPTNKDLVNEESTNDKDSVNKEPCNEKTADKQEESAIEDTTETTLTSETTPEKMEESVIEKAATENQESLAIEKAATETDNTTVEEAAVEFDDNCSSAVEKTAMEIDDTSAVKNTTVENDVTSTVEKKAVEIDDTSAVKNTVVENDDTSAVEKATVEIDDKSAVKNTTMENNDTSIVEETEDTVVEKTAVKIDDTSAVEKTSMEIDDTTNETIAAQSQPTSEMVIEDSLETTACLNKKRKLEADEDDCSEPDNHKKHKLEEAEDGVNVVKQTKAETNEPIQEDTEMLEDTEVTTSLPAQVREESLQSEVSKPEEIQEETASSKPTAETEQECTKEESVVVETDSNPPSDIGGASSVDIEPSGATSSVSITEGQTSEDSNVEQAKESTSPNQNDVSQTQNVASTTTAEPSSPQNNSSDNSEVNPAAAQPQDVSATDSVTGASQPSPKLVPEAVEVQTESSPLTNDSAAHVTPPPCQNGTAEESVVVNSGLHLPPSPNTKSHQTLHKPYVPSSTAIDSRKFIPNPAFPVEMMDPAYWFSVVSYNILADCHLSRGDYSYTQPQYLTQDYRHGLLLKELDYLDGDIVCLQEVGSSYYAQTLLPAMTSRGYEGHYIKRTKDYMDEGEATFVRTSKLDIVSQQSMSLKDLAIKEVEASGLLEDVSVAAKKYLDRSDVILLTELKCKKTGKTLVVCNIHVFHDTASPDVQCIQVACAIKQLVAKAGSDLNPHIICGDFNSDVTSPVYHLARDGYLSDDHIRRLQSLETLDNADGSSRSLIHHIWGAFQHTSSNLKSTYELALGKEPPVTYFTRTSKSLDHIFHSSASIDNVGILETLDIEVVEASGGLPSKSIPSDHLSIKAVFRLK